MKRLSKLTCFLVMRSSRVESVFIMESGWSISMITFAVVEKSFWVMSVAPVIITWHDSIFLLLTLRAFTFFPSCVPCKLLQCFPNNAALNMQFFAATRWKKGKRFVMLKNDFRSDSLLKFSWHFILLIADSIRLDREARRRWTFNKNRLYFWL